MFDVFEFFEFVISDDLILDYKSKYVFALQLYLSLFFSLPWPLKKI